MIKTGFRLDADLVEKIKSTTKSHNLTISELLNLALNSYQAQEIKKKKNKEMISVIIAEDTNNAILEIAAKQNVNVSAAAADIFNQFFSKNLI